MDTESHLSKCQANPHQLSFQNYLCFCCHSTGRDYSINASSSSPLKYINPQILVSQATNLAQVTFSNHLHPDFDRLKLAHNYTQDHLANFHLTLSAALKGTFRRILPNGLLKKSASFCLD